VIFILTLIVTMFFWVPIFEFFQTIFPPPEPPLP